MKLLFCLAISLLAVSAFGFQRHDFSCQEVNNTNNITCNTTIKDWLMNVRPLVLNFTQCIYDPNYWNRNATNCSQIGDTENYRIECPHHINSTAQSNKCRIYTILSRDYSSGYYNSTGNAVWLDNYANREVPTCHKYKRNQFTPKEFNWEYLYHCREEIRNYNFECNCYNYARYFPKQKLYCQIYELSELMLD
jgi:hypothetical protein